MTACAIIGRNRALIDDQISLMQWTLCASYLCWVPYNYVFFVVVVVGLFFFFVYETFMLSKGYPIALANQVCTWYKGT